jgi:hypothetical protein
MKKSRRKGSKAGTNRKERNSKGRNRKEQKGENGKEQKRKEDTPTQPTKPHDQHQRATFLAAAALPPSPWRWRVIKWGAVGLAWGSSQPYGCRL